MAGKNLDYWYDAQIKRYLIQLVRVFSHFKVKEFTDGGVNYNRVPARYGDISRMVALILKNNSENVIQSVPQITVSISNIGISPERRQDPYFVDTTQVAEREWDKENGVYTSEQGNLYTTQRYMPVPYDLTINVDIWTSNTDTKLQILEQLMVIFNPSIQLQSNDNPLDWTSIFELELSDITWSSRSLPQGVDEQIDITTLAFNVPIWISPPAKVKRQKIIQQIVADVHLNSNISELGFDAAYYDFFDQIDANGGTVIVTPGNYKVQLANGVATLVDENSNPANWLELVEMQGELSETSRIEFNTSNDHENLNSMVIGKVVINPLSNTQLIFTLDPDTLPSNTLSDVNKIINPQVSRPGGTLAPQQTGQRYLITEDISTDFVEWGNITANENDIIEFDGNAWNIVFDASANAQEIEHLKNNNTGAQFKWTGSAWISSYEGEYNPGFWRLVL